MSSKDSNKSGFRQLPQENWNGTYSIVHCKKKNSQRGSSSAAQQPSMAHSSLDKTDQQKWLKTSSNKQTSESLAQQVLEPSREIQPRQKIKNECQASAQQKKEIVAKANQTTPATPTTAGTDRGQACSSAEVSDTAPTGLHPAVKPKPKESPLAQFIDQQQLKNNAPSNKNKFNHADSDIDIDIDIDADAENKTICAKNVEKTDIQASSSKRLPLLFGMVICAGISLAGVSFSRRAKDQDKLHSSSFSQTKNGQAAPSTGKHFTPSTHRQVIPSNQQQVASLSRRDDRYSKQQRAGSFIRRDAVKLENEAALANLANFRGEEIKTSQHEMLLEKQDNLAQNSSKKAKLRDETREVQDFPIQVKVEVVEGSVILPVKLKSLSGNEIEAKLMLDTGASYTTLSRELLSSLGLVPTKGKMKLDTVGGHLEVELAMLESVAVGNALVSGGVTAAVCTQCTHASAMGMLGLNFLKHFDFTLDLKAQVLGLREKNEPIDRLFDIRPFLEISIQELSSSNEGSKKHLVIVNHAPRPVKDIVLVARSRNQWQPVKKRTFLRKIDTEAQHTFDLNQVLPQIIGDYAIEIVNASW